MKCKNCRCKVIYYDSLRRWEHWNDIAHGEDGSCKCKFPEPNDAHLGEYTK